MQVIVDLCVVPLGVGTSVSAYVAECHKVLTRARLKTHLHAYCTNVEGDYDAVFTAIKECHQAVHAPGAPRITITNPLGTRTDREQSMEDKVQSRPQVRSS